MEKSSAGRVSRGRIAAGASIGAALSVLAVCVNTASATGDVAPGLALALWPRHAEATLWKGVLMMKNETAPPAAVSLARKSVALDPTSPKAFAIIAMDPRASISAKDRALAYSRVLSRRDEATTLLLLRRSIERNDVKGFFSNFDIAFRTSEKAADQFSPVVVKAMIDNRVIDGLASLLAKRPPWGREFLLAAIEGAPAATKANRLMTAVIRSGVKVDSDYAGVLVSRLVAEGEFAEAWTLFRNTYPNRAKAEMRPIARSLKSPTGFDWVLSNEPDLWAQIEGPGEGNALRYFANAGAGGVVARQFLVLPRGSYTFSFAGSTQAGSAFQAEWAALCRGTEPLAQTDARRSGRLAFVVPAGCPAVELRLSANSDVNVSENQGLIAGMRLKKIR